MTYTKLDHEGYAKYIGVNIGKNLHIYGNPYEIFGTEPWIIKLGNDVHITRGCLFITHDGGTLILRHLIKDLEVTKPIVVKDNVYIGVNSVILSGVTIGNNCIIAAGSVVTKDIPDNCVYGGVPAIFIKTIDKYLEKISKESLHFGHLNGKKKDKALRNYYKNLI